MSLKSKITKIIAVGALISAAVVGIQKFHGEQHGEELEEGFRTTSPPLEQVIKKEKPKKEFEKVLGVNVPSWTKGDYPYGVSWKPQRYFDSQGIINSDITTNKPFMGKGSLELTLEIQRPSKIKQQGEANVDLRHGSNYRASKPLVFKKSNDGKPLGVDLSGKTITVLVYCGRGTAGDEHTPNGLQIETKSLTIEDGKEVWRSYYADWKNIWRWSRDYHADPQLGNILEGRWSLISMRLPDPAKDKITKPVYGCMDKGFDPRSVALIGVKYGSNEHSGKEEVSSKIWIDELCWMDIESNGDFEFYSAEHGDDIEMWDKMINGETVFYKKEGKVYSAKAKDIVEFPFEEVEDPISVMKENGFDTAALVQTEYMPSPTSSVIKPHNEKSHKTDELENAMKYFKSKGMRVIFKPHVDVLDDSWRGDINPENKAEWFKSYTDFIAYYAQLAEKHDAEMLIVGTEFKSMTGPENKAEWEEIIKKVREVYSGKLTYAANWDEYKDCCLWDLVDIKSLDVYVHLSDKKNPSLAELIEAWSKTTWKGEERHWIEEIEEFHKKDGKNVLFAEIGYMSMDYAANEPWDFKVQYPINEELQANCYLAMTEAFKDKRWLKGFLIWNVLPIKDYGGKFNTDYTPLMKRGGKVFDLKNGG